MMYVPLIYSLGLSGRFMLCRHLQGENIQPYNLFRPVMMNTWWMKLGGSLPPRHNALLFPISGTGSSICPVTQTTLYKCDKCIFFIIFKSCVYISACDTIDHFTQLRANNVKTVPCKSFWRLHPWCANIWSTGFERSLYLFSDFCL